MPVLDCPKAEIYAQNRAKGKTQVVSYVAAGFEEHDGNAWRYESGNERIKARIEELQGTAAERAGVTIEWWVEAVKALHDDGDYTARNNALEKLAKHIGAYKVDNEQKTNAKAQEEFIKAVEASRRDK
jgi:hypothetical protein